MKVAFICVHNSCRSQIAEALGKYLASDVFELTTIIPQLQVMSLKVILPEQKRNRRSIRMQFA